VTCGFAYLPARRLYGTRAQTGDDSHAGRTRAIRADAILGPRCPAVRLRCAQHGVSSTSHIAAGLQQVAIHGFGVGQVTYCGGS